jgi:nicotinamidase-related amidase
MKTLKLTQRSQQLVRDRGTRRWWKTVEKKVTLPASKTALLLCDVWDNHTSRGARERLEAMVPRMNEVVKSCRAKGVRIVHAPSDTIPYYNDHPARKRVLACPRLKLPKDAEHADPPLPVITEGGASDTVDDWTKADPMPWTREHPGIDLADEDAVSANGREVYSLMKHEGIRHMLIMGVHTNMCILHRTFAIKQMVRWGVDVRLIRDFTDAMYDPAKPPYVSHDEGTQLVIGYIEKFWCPTIESGDLL